MPKVTSRCELMDNAFPAGEVKLKGNFFVAEDEAGENMIFSVDGNGALQLIVKDETGSNTIVDLSSKFGLAATEVVTALAVNQNKNGKIHLVFAARQGNGPSKLFVVEPMAPDRRHWNTKESLTNRLYSGERWSINIREVLLGSSNDDEKSYPCFYMVFNHIDKTTEDIWAVCVDVESRGWARQRKFELPVNPICIVDKCPANIPWYRGLFVLYRESDSLQLRFVGFNPTRENPTLKSFPQGVPKGANKLVSFENASGHTDLFISGTDGLSYRTAQQFFDVDKSPLKILSPDPAFKETSQVQVAQTKEHLSIWTLSSQKALSYQEFSIPSTEDQVPTEVTPVIPLLETVSGNGRFACLRNPRLGQRLFFLDNTNTIRMLEQSIEGGIWQQPVEISIPHSDKMIEFSSHTIHISIEENDGTPMSLQPILLNSSISVECLVNGAWIRTSPKISQTVSTDVAGTLTIILRSQGLSTPVITLTSPSPDQKIFSGGRLEIDPMTKLWSTISRISSAQDLRNMKLPDGSSFVREGLSDEELEAAAKTLAHLHNVKSEMAGESNGLFDSIKDGFQVIAQRAWGAVQHITYKIKEAVEHGVQKVKEVVELGVKKVKDAWNFVVETTNKVWNLVLETASQVAAAMQTVLDTVVKGWEALKQSLAFIFSWGDIIATKNVLANLTTHGILLVADGAPLLELKTHAFFQKLRGKIKELNKANLPPDLDKLQVGKNEEMQRKAREKSGAKDKLLATDKDSKTPQAQYASYHIKHSGTSGGRGAGEKTPFGRILVRLNKTVDEAEQLASRLAGNINSLFDLSTDVSIGTIMAKLGFDLLEDILDVLESLFMAFLGCISELLVEIADKINQRIQIPILSPMYRKVSGGSDLTLLDALSLVVAIPTTIIFKIAVGKSPSKLDGIEHLTRPDAMRKELDERMAGLRSDQMAATPHFVITKKAAAIPISDAESKRDREVVEAKQVSNSEMDPVDAPLYIQVSEIESNSQGNDEIQRKTMVEKRFSRFGKDMGATKTLLHISLPASAIFDYTLFVWPSLLTPQESGYLMRNIVPTLSLVKWLGSLERFMNPDDITKCLSKMDEPGFLPRFVLWIASGIPVLTSFISKKVGHIFGVIASSFEIFLLAWEQIEVHGAEGDYSIYLALEEWLNCIGKLVHYSAGWSKKMSVAKAAFVLCNAGMAMGLCRSIAEVAGKMTPQYTGMGLGP